MARNKQKKRGLSAAARDVLRSVGRSKSRFFAIFGIVFIPYKDPFAVFKEQKVFQRISPL